MRAAILNKINFHYQAPLFHFPERTRLKSFLLKLFRKEGVSIEHIRYIFCTDEYLIKLNKTYLRHNTYTDIITFDLTEPGAELNAEIYISTERVKDNASIYNSSFNQELHRVIFHGALHLSGYNDKTKADSSKMRSMEDYYLKNYFKST